MPHPNGLPLGFRDRLILILSVFLVGFHVYTSLFGLLEAVLQRGLHLAVVLCLLFLSKPCKRKGIGPFVDAALIAMSVSAVLYTFLQYDEIVSRGGRFTTLEVVLGSLLIVALAEGSRRVLGPSLTVIAAAAMAYNIFGSSISLFGLGFRQMSFSRIIYNQVFTTEGIYSSPLGSVATFVVTFLLFAEILDATGARAFLMDFALMTFGKKRGGAAKVAVVSSGLFGMVSGSSVANVVSTGVITIPLMKKSGFPAKLAGAVEACASTGGMLAPPIMGAAAFVMAEVLGVSYLEVLKAAIVPALLYYAAIYLVIEFKTQDGKNSYTVDENDLGIRDFDKKQLFVKLLTVILPIGVMIYLMNRLSVQKAVMIAILVMLIVAVLTGNSEGLKHPVKICQGTAKHVISVAMATALGGVVVGVINFTGLGFKISNLLITLSGGSLLMLCIMSMCASIVFGMGLPPTACYILIALLVAPVMVDQGVLPMAAHLFAFYFGILSNITPPVAVASFAAAPIAESPPMAVGWQGFIIMLDLLLVPYGFVYYPALLLGEGTTLAAFLEGFLTISYAIILGASCIAGYLFRNRLSAPERVLITAVALAVFSPQVPFLINTAFFAAVMAFYWFKYRRKAALIQS